MLNTELAKINQWIQCNRLSLNIEKTNYMIMADPRNKVYHENCKITINGQNIICVHNTKFLGVIIDESMSWKHHIEYICNKTYKCRLTSNVWAGYSPRLLRLLRARYTPATRPLRARYAPATRPLLAVDFSHENPIIAH